MVLSSTILLNDFVQSAEKLPNPNSDLRTQLAGPRGGRMEFVLVDLCRSRCPPYSYLIDSNPLSLDSSTTKFFSFIPYLSLPLWLTECITAFPISTSIPGPTSKIFRFLSLRLPRQVVALVVRHKCNSIFMTQPQPYSTKLRSRSWRTCTLLPALTIPPLQCGGKYGMRCRSFIL